MQYRITRDEWECDHKMRIKGIKLHPTNRSSINGMKFAHREPFIIGKHNTLCQKLFYTKNVICLATFLPINYTE